MRKTPCIFCIVVMETGIWLGAVASGLGCILYTEGVVEFKATSQGCTPGPSLPNKYLIEDDSSTSSDLSSPSAISPLCRTPGQRRYRAYPGARHALRLLEQVTQIPPSPLQVT